MTLTYVDKHSESDKHSTTLDIKLRAKITENRWTKIMVTYGANTHGPFEVLLGILSDQ